MNAQLEVEISGKLDGLQTALNQAMQKIDDFTGKVKNSSDKVESAFKKMERAGSALSDIGGRLSVALTAPIVLLGKASITAYAELDSLKRGLSAVMGAGADLNGELTKLKEVAKLPGLGFKEAIEGSVRLQAAGFSADAARRTLMSFGNALATVGKGKASLDLVTLALTQMQNKTSGFGQDMRQLTEQLPQLRGALQKTFGTSETDKIAEMGYTGAQVVQMLTNEFAKLPKVTGGVGNALENLQDSLFTSSARMGEAIDKAFGLENRFNQLGDSVTELTNWFTSLSPEMQRFSFLGAGIAAALGPVALILGQILTLMPKISAGFGLLFTRILPIAGIVTGIYKAFKAVYDLFTLDWSAPANKISAALLKIGKSVDVTGLGGILADKMTEQLEKNPLLQGKTKIKPLGLSSQILNFATGSKGDGTYKVPLVAPDSAGADFMKTGNDLGKKLGDGIKDSLRRALVQSQIDFENFLAKIEALTLKQDKIGATKYGKLFATGIFGDVQNLKGKDATLLPVNNLPLPKIDSGIIQGIQDKGIAQRQAELNEQLQETIDKLNVISPLTNAIGEQFTNLVINGTFSFKAIGEALKQLITKLITAATTAAILAALTGGFSATEGGKGFAAIFKGILGFADGGVVTKPTLGMIGEAGQSEAVIPLPRLFSQMNNIFKAGQNSNSAGLQGVTVVVNQDRFGNWNLNQQVETYRNRIG